MRASMNIIGGATTTIASGQSFMRGMESTIACR